MQLGQALAHGRTLGGEGWIQTACRWETVCSALTLCVLSKTYLDILVLRSVYDARDGGRLGSGRRQASMFDHTDVTAAQTYVWWKESIS
jgi:hypothetical protein